MSILVIASSLYRTIATPDSSLFSIAWTFVVLLDYFSLYQKYHNICVEARQDEMTEAGLADGMTGNFSKRRVLWI
jgi:hypothetical protein